MVHHRYLPERPGAAHPVEAPAATICRRFAFTLPPSSSSQKIDRVQLELDDPVHQVAAKPTLVFFARRRAILARVRHHLSETLPRRAIEGITKAERS